MPSLMLSLSLPPLSWVAYKCSSPFQTQPKHQLLHGPPDSPPGTTPSRVVLISLHSRGRARPPAHPAAQHPTCPSARRGRGSGPTCPVPAWNGTEWDGMGRNGAASHSTDGRRPLTSPHSPAPLCESWGAPALCLPVKRQDYKRERAAATT